MCVKLIIIVLVIIVGLFLLGNVSSVTEPMTDLNGNDIKNLKDYCKGLVSEAQPTGPDRSCDYCGANAEREFVVVDEKNKNNSNDLQVIEAVRYPRYPACLETPFGTMKCMPDGYYPSYPTYDWYCREFYPSEYYTY